MRVVLLHRFQSYFNIVLSEGHSKQSLGNVIVPIAKIPTKAATNRNTPVTVAVTMRRNI